MVEKIALIRHGVTEANLQKRYAGATDLPLIAEGEAQAKTMARHIKALKPDRILSSPLRRALDTARIAAGGLEVEIEVDDNLREVDFGQWENMSYTEIVKDHEEEMNRWFAWDPDFAFPGGESFKGFSERVNIVKERMLNDSAKTLIAFTHGGVIGHFICLMLNIPPQKQFTFALPPASYALFESKNGAMVFHGIHDPARRDGEA